MHIKYANDYGYRVAIGVILNSDDPEYEHDPEPGFEPQDHLEPPEGLEPWEYCPGCRYRWNIQEFIFENETLFNISADGSTTRKTDAELIDSIKHELSIVESNVTSLSNLVGAEV